MENIIAVAVLIIIVGLAAGYIIKAKKSGKKCIGCPYADTCGTAQNGKCTCTDTEEDR